MAATQTESQNQLATAEALTPIESKARDVVNQRRRESENLRNEGKTLGEMRDHFDNDYSPLEALYREKVGTDLIGDPYEAAKHEIPITQTCSIVLPSYNNTERLRQSLLALQASTFNAKYPRNLEVVIVDDGSPKEDIAAVVESMGLKDINVKVYRQSNGRVAKARYSGVLNATGDIVIITDPDVVYTPTTVEEFMKRHEVIEGAAFFGLRDEIQSSDERLTEERIASGSLEELPYRMNKDIRVADDAMVDCDWLKKVGHNGEVPMGVGYGWRLSSVAWGLSISARREDLLKVVSGYDDDFVGYGYDDEYLISNLIAQGTYIIPNTAGIAYHQWHDSTIDPDKREVNRQVYEKNLASKIVDQDTSNPLRTDAELRYRYDNPRTDGHSYQFTRPADIYTEAKVLMDMGLSERAIPLFESVMSQRENDVWFLHDFGKTLVATCERQNILKGIKLLERSRELNPGETWIHSTLAIAYGRAGRYEDSLRSYQQARTLYEDNSEAAIIGKWGDDPFDRARHLHEEGQKYWKGGKLRDALRFYEGAVSLVGESGSPWSLYDKAHILFDMENYADAIEPIERARRRMPDEAWPDLLKADILRKLGKTTEAEELYSLAIRKKGDDPAVVRRSLQRFAEGETLSKRRSSLELETEGSDANLKKAHELMDRGDFDNAVAVYSAHYKQNEENFWYLHDYGSALISTTTTSNVAKGIVLLERCRNLNPSETWVQSALAIGYARAGRYTESVDAYREALMLYSGNQYAQVVNREERTDQQHRDFLHERGVSLMNEASSISDQSARINKYMEALRYHEASVAFAGGIQNMPWAEFDRAKILFYLGKKEEAVASLEKVRDRMPHETWVHSQLGIVYESLGQEDKSRAEFKEALRIKTDNEEAQEGLKKKGKIGDLGLYDWDEHKNLRSATLNENPQAQLDEREEIKNYLNGQEGIYIEELRQLNAVIDRPMSETCRVVVAIPARQEGKVIKKALEKFLSQKDKNGNQLDRSFFEIVIMDNHAEDVPQDDTQQEVAVFQSDHPEIRISYAHKVWKKGEGSVGKARKYACDVAVLRDLERKNANGDLILVNSDADIEKLDEKYISTVIEDFDSDKNLDALTGKWTLPPEALSKPNLRAAERLWHILDRVIQRDHSQPDKDREYRSPNLIGRNSALRSSIYSAVGGFNPNARLAEDMEMGWMIRTARGWGDSTRVKYDNSIEVVSDARRFLSTMVSGVPLIKMYDDFHESDEIKKLDIGELIEKIPDEFDIYNLEMNADAIWRAGQDGQYRWHRNFQELFAETMRIMGVKYALENTMDSDGQTRSHVRLTDTNQLEKSLNRNN